MAAQLYDSLHGKLLALPDSVAVYPAHGAGSLCGRNISSETSSTVGVQRRTNYALHPMPKEDFVRMMTVDLPEAPAYFPRDVEINRSGAPSLPERRAPAALSPADVERLVEGGAILVDVRPAAAFGAGHPAGAVNVGLGGQFASWSGALLPPERPLVLVTEDESGAAEAVTRLARVGLENVAGYLDGGVAAWDASGRPLGRMGQIDVAELKARLAEDPGLLVYDVRRPREYAAGHVPRAVSVPLDQLARELDGRTLQGPVAIICASGYRSSIAAACSSAARESSRSTSSAARALGSRQGIRWSEPQRPLTPSKKLCRPSLSYVAACIYARVFLSKKFPLPALPRNFPFSTITSPREITVSVAPWTTRPSYGV